MQFQKGDHVRYGSSICRIEDIAPMDPSQRDVLYYVLSPLDDSRSTYYIPVGSEKLHALLTAGEIENLLAGLRNKKLDWCPDRKVRAELFQQMLRQGDPCTLLQMIHCMLQKKDDPAFRLSPKDSSVLNSAVKAIDQEFAFVLKIQEKDVGSYIRARVPK